MRKAVTVQKRENWHVDSEVPYFNYSKDFATFAEAFDWVYSRLGVRIEAIDWAAYGVPPSGSVTVMHERGQ